jgi:hypothetical protein
MDESFNDFVRRTPVEALHALCAPAGVGTH